MVRPWPPIQSSVSMVRIPAVEHDVFDVMGTCRAMCWLRPAPVDPALVKRVLWAATRAPSPGNTQNWDFVVVDDATAKARIGEAVHAVMAGLVAAMDRPDRTMRLISTAPPTSSTRSPRRR